MNTLGALLLASALAVQHNVYTTVVFDQPIGPANRCASRQPGVMFAADWP